MMEGESSMPASKYYQQSVETVLRELATDANRGLSTSEVEKRVKQFGANRLAEPSRPSLLVNFLRQFQDFMVMVLIGATLISALLGETADALAILAIILCNAFLGFIQEYKAERSLEALHELVAPTCVVLRDGRETEIEAAGLVPGDIVFLASGQSVPADGRLLDDNLLSIEEAALTGESHTVEKAADLVLSGTVPLGDRRNSVFMGTTVVRGKGRFVVTDIGMDTEIGKIAAIISRETTPLLPANYEEAPSLIGRGLGVHWPLRFVLEGTIFPSPISHRAIVTGFVESVSTNCGLPSRIWRALLAALTTRE
jgi:Ca2+-transporting ATPase